MYVITKEISYTITADTEKEQEVVAKELQDKLREKYNTVDKYWNGKYSMRVVAQDVNDIHLHDSNS